jgi:hypothetical protein
LLIAALVALVVFDTTKVDGTADEAAEAGPDAFTPPGQEPEEPVAEEPPLHPEMDAACANVAEEIGTARSHEFVEALGEQLLARMTEAEIVSLCKDIEALPLDQKLTRIASATELPANTPAAAPGGTTAPAPAPAPAPPPATP